MMRIRNLQPLTLHASIKVDAEKRERTEKERRRKKIESDKKKRGLPAMTQRDRETDGRRGSRVGEEITS
jgi:hypothetical protein